MEGRWGRRGRRGRWAPPPEPVKRRGGAPEPRTPSSECCSREPIGVPCRRLGEPSPGGSVAGSPRRRRGEASRESWPAGADVQCGTAEDGGLRRSRSVGAAGWS
jgi:hypothetical protein